MTEDKRLSRKDIQILLDLLEQGEEAITENINKPETGLTQESADRLRKRLSRIRTILLSMSEDAAEEAV